MTKHNWVSEEIVEHMKAARKLVEYRVSKEELLTPEDRGLLGLLSAVIAAESAKAEESCRCHCSEEREPAKIRGTDMLVKDGRIFVDKDGRIFSDKDWRAYGGYIPEQNKDNVRTSLENSVSNLLYIYDHNRSFGVREFVSSLMRAFDIKKR